MLDSILLSVATRPSEGYGTYRVRDRRKVIRPTLGKGSEHEGAFDLLQNGDRNSL